MLELLFQGFIEWLYGIVLECWEYFASVLFNLMSLDFAYLREHIPIIDTIRQIMLGVGWALLIGNLAYQAMRAMTAGLGFEAEDPKLLFTRTFAFSFLLVVSPQICELGLNMTATVIDLLEMPDAVNITFADDASFAGLAGSWLLVVICGIVVMFQSFKLIMEMAERYFILAVLTITAPLAFGMGGSKNTSDIFSGWCRMFGSMCLLMVTNVMFVKMLLSVLSYYPSGLDVLPWMILVVTIVKVAKKADSILTRIGLNPAMTGDPLGRGFPGALTMMVVRSLASNAAHTISRNSDRPRGASGKPNPNTPTGPRSGGTGSGSSAVHASMAANAYSHNTSAQNSSAASGVTQEAAAAQASTAQEVFTQNTTEKTASVSQNPSPANGGPSNPTRRTSVPPGTKRSPGHTAKAEPSRPFGTDNRRTGTAQSVMGFAETQNTQQEQTHSSQADTHTHSSNVGASVNSQTRMHSTEAAGKQRFQNPPRSMHQTPGSAAIERQTEKMQDASTQTNTFGQRSAISQTSEIAGTAHAAVPSPSPRSGMAGTAAPAPESTKSAAGLAVPIGTAGNQASLHKAEGTHCSPNRDTAGNGVQPKQTDEPKKTQDSGSAGMQRASIGGRYTQPVQQSTHLSAGGNAQVTQQNQVSNQSVNSAVKSPAETRPEGRSTNRTPSSVPPARRETAASQSDLLSSERPHASHLLPSVQSGAAGTKVPPAVSQAPSAVVTAERQSRNQVPVSPVPPVSAPQEQKSVKRVPQTDSSPIRPAPQERKAGISTGQEKREQPSYHRPGTAGIAPAAAASKAETVPTAQKPTAEKPAKRPFVPLTGKLPESIPSHLDLHETSQKSSKRPSDDTKEVEPNV